MTEQQIAEMVNRFLGWKLPKDFAPDAGISFNPTRQDSYDEPGSWPVGTNLFTADQARAMVLHMLDMPNDLAKPPVAASCASPRGATS